MSLALEAVKTATEALREVPHLDYHEARLYAWQAVLKALPPPSPDEDEDDYYYHILDKALDLVLSRRKRP